MQILEIIYHNDWMETGIVGSVSFDNETEYTITRTLDGYRCNCENFGKTKDLGGRDFCEHIEEFFKGRRRIFGINENYDHNNANKDLFSQ